LRPSPTSPSATRRIERGLVEPSPETTVALARTFGISIERLRRLLAEAQSEEVSA
jgi:transcriptional regulator with XRE-family HTH domain